MYMYVSKYTGTDDKLFIKVLERFCIMRLSGTMNFKVRRVPRIPRVKGN